MRIIRISEELNCPFHRLFQLCIFICYCTKKTTISIHYSSRKDRLFIYLAPIFHWKTQPASVFNHAMPYEKLRICLNYTAHSTREGCNFIC